MSQLYFWFLQNKRRLRPCSTPVKSERGDSLLLILDINSYQGFSLAFKYHKSREQFLVKYIGYNYMERQRSDSGDTLDHTADVRKSW